MPDNLEQRAAAFLALAEKATAKYPGLAAPDASFEEWMESQRAFKSAARNDAPALVADLLAEVRRLQKENQEAQVTELRKLAKAHVAELRVPTPGFTPDDRYLNG